MPFILAAVNVTWIISRSGRSFRIQRLIRNPASDFGPISEAQAKCPTKKKISWLKPGFGKGLCDARMLHKSNPSSDPIRLLIAKQAFLAPVAPPPMMGQ
jgi:hypothetical protein